MNQHVIFHHNDLDGRCAAAIMARWYGQSEKLRFVEVDYKDEINIKDLDPTDIVSVVDFSFKPDIMAEVRKWVSSVIWCDHHVTAKDYGYDDLPGVRDFNDKGLSGCECVWKYCYPNTPAPMGVQLIGDYDSWRLEFAPDCYRFYEGMKLLDTHPTSLYWVGVIDESPDFAQTVLKAGTVAIKYRDNYCAGMQKSFGYETEIGGQKAFALNVFGFGSPGFGDKMKEYPVCIAYIHDGKKFTVSLYSTTVDVSKIAKTFGGGGHKGAAGFVCKELPFIVSPR